MLTKEHRWKPTYIFTDYKSWQAVHNNNLGFQTLTKDKVSICIDLSWYYLWITSSSIYLSVILLSFTWLHNRLIIHGDISTEMARKSNNSVFHTSVKVSVCFYKGTKYTCMNLHIRRIQVLMLFSWMKDTWLAILW